MILDRHIKKLFFYVIELSLYFIIMSLSWLHHHVIDVNFEHNILILFFFFCLNYCCLFLIKIYDFNQQEENFLFKVNKVTSFQSSLSFAWKKQLSFQFTHKKQLSFQFAHKKQFNFQFTCKKQLSFSSAHKKQSNLSFTHKKSTNIQLIHKKQISFSLVSCLK